jgi:thiol:disulfide interchange protein DsbA
MNLPTRLFQILALVVILAGSCAVPMFSSAANRPDEKPEVKVIEFFSYTCPHCYRFEGPLGNWRKTKGGGIRFERVHVMFGNQSDRLPRLYFALQELGEERLHEQVFRQIHTQHTRFDSDRAVLEFTSKNGMDNKRFLASYNSAQAFEYARESKRLQDRMKVRSVPTLVVADRYQATLSQFAQPASGFEYVLQLLHFSSQDDRKEAAAAAQALGAADKFIELAAPGKN